MLGGCDHDLGEAVGLGVCLQRTLGVGREDIGRAERCGLNAGYNGGDRAGEDVLVVGRQGLVVHLGKGGDALGALALLVMAAREGVGVRSGWR